MVFVSKNWRVLFIIPMDLAILDVMVLMHVLSMKDFGEWLDQGTLFLQLFQ